MHFAVLSLGEELQQRGIAKGLPCMSVTIPAVGEPVSSSSAHFSVPCPSAQAHTTFCWPLLHVHGAVAKNQKVLITSETPGISTSQLPSLTKVLGESYLSSFVLERWAQRYIQKRYAVAPVCPPEDDLKEQD